MDTKLGSAVETRGNVEISPEPSLNTPRQGYKVNPITRLHLCQTCPYHKYRNKTKPWLKKEEKQA